jgi:hypothetical protein
MLLVAEIGYYGLLWVILGCYLQADLQATIL